LIIVVLALVCLNVSSLQAQVTATATVDVTTVDKTQAVVPGVTITLTNKATNESRTGISGDNGTSRFDLVPPGTYSAKASLSGFKTAVADNIEVLVNRTTAFTFSLEVGGVTEEISVTAVSLLVDTEKTSVGQDITPEEVESLPLNGRDIGNLAYMVPGAQPVSSYDPTKMRIGVFGINGSGGRNVNVTVNGIDNKDATVGGPVMQLPLSAVQEFNISTQRFSAANGRSEGAAVNLITKAGGNSVHGGGYFFDTQTGLNANNYFSIQGGQPTPQFERQQFGGDIGFPIVKDKLFGFGTVERLREHTALGVTTQAFNELSLAKSLGAQPANTIPTPYFDWRYNGRADWNINSNNRVYVSYAGQKNNSLNDQASQTVDLTEGNFTTNKLIISNLTWSSILSPRTVNTVTAGYQYWENLIDTAKYSAFTISFPSSISFGTNGNVPQESVQKKWQFKDDLSVTYNGHGLKLGVDYVAIPYVGGFFGFTPVPALTFNDLPSVITSNSNGKYPQGFATAGAVTSMAGAAGNPSFADVGAKQFGAYLQDDWKIRRNLMLNIGVRWDEDYNLQGANVQSKARAYLLLKQINSPFASKLPENDKRGVQPRVGFSWDVTGSAKHLIRGGYGLYFGNTFQNIPLFMEQQANPYIFATVFSLTSQGPGTDCDPSNTGVCTVPGTNIKLSNWRFGVDPNPALPSAPTSLPAGATGRIMDPNYRNPYTEEFNVGYTFQLNNSNAIEVNYIHTLGLHEAARLNINPIDPVSGVRILHSAFAAAGLTSKTTPAEPGIIIDDASIGRSRWDGLEVSWRRRLSHRFSINTSYVLSRALGYGGSPAGFGNAWVNPFKIMDPAVDFGHVGNDERHRWSGAGLWDLPWGFEVAPIIQASTPRSITPGSGQSNFFGYGSSTGAAHAIVPANDPTNFTYYSALNSSAASIATELACLNSGQCIQVPLGAARGYGFFNTDLRVSKAIKTGDWGKLNLIFQAFDLTNRANFGTNVNTSIRASAGGFKVPLGFIAGSGTVVPKSFRAEFGAELKF
jgi:hypothetical protein